MPPLQWRCEIRGRSVTVSKVGCEVARALAPLGGSPAPVGTNPGLMRTGTPRLQFSQGMSQPLYVGGATIAIALPSHIIMVGLPISMIIGWRLKNAL